MNFLSTFAKLLYYYEDNKKYKSLEIYDIDLNFS